MGLLYHVKRPLGRPNYPVTIEHRTQIKRRKTINIRNIFLGSVLLGVLLGVRPSFGYDVIQVENGGTVSGRVMTPDPQPKSKKFPFIRSPNIEYCEQISDGHGNRELREFFVGKGGELKNVVIAIDGIKRGKPFPAEPPRATIHLCQFEPFVAVFWKPYTLFVENRDPLLHILVGIQGEATRRPALFLLPLSEYGTRTIRFKFRRNRRIMGVQCEVHSFDQMWGISVDNPYFAVTGEDGRFSIPDIPPGSYSLSVWHPLKKIESRSIRVDPGSVTHLDIEMKVGEVDLPQPGLSGADQAYPTKPKKKP